uniref:N-acyl-aromatic-L-amino acid amidohydrolase n=1 Tax=Electrophorus electricus TaxID=8005 RepID=A0A4W4GGL6_ELEEL
RVTLSCVALCGGTHGNELSGIYLVQETLKNKRKGEAMEAVTVVTVISNPRAVQQRVRYTETDLNLTRISTFSLSLSAPVSERTPYEIIRSQELNSLLGPKGSGQAVDLICDLHNTTANMGLCLITYADSDWICLHICKHLHHLLICCFVFLVFHSVYNPYSKYLSVCHGAMEIGPQPHGVIRSNIFTAMQEAVHLMLDWVRLFNSGTQFDEGSVDVYTMVKNIDYPRDPYTHNITAAVHPELQDRDFCLLYPGDPIFLSFSGEILRYKGKEPLYPFFINECAYYEKGVALLLARKSKVKIPAIQCSRA